MTILQKPFLAVAAVVTFGSAPAATLSHQWNFNNGTDNIGGANVTLVGGANYSGGSLVLPGGGTFANYGSVNIAPTLNSTTSLTVEAWFTINALSDWSKVWMFGQDTAGQPSLSYINFTPRTGLAGNMPKTDFDSITGVEFNTTAGANPAALSAGQEYHVVTIYDSATDTQSFYINGVLADTGSMGGGNISQLNPNTMRFGAGFFYADGDLNGRINEISIWKGALTPAQVLAEFNAGPDAIAVVPEPAAIGLLGLAGLAAGRRRRRA